MSTRAHVGIQNADGTIDYIYNHYDGYPTALGKYLYRNFDNEDLIRSLLANGDASSIEESAFYSDMPNGAGEDVALKTAKDIKEFLAHSDGIDYQYLWYRENNDQGEWMYTKWGKDEWKYLD